MHNIRRNVGVLRASAARGRRRRSLEFGFGLERIWKWGFKNVSYWGTRTSLIDVVLSGRSPSVGAMTHRLEGSEELVGVGVVEVGVDGLVDFVFLLLTGSGGGSVGSRDEPTSPTTGGAAMIGRRARRSSWT